MSFDKNILRFLQFRESVLDISELEEKHEIKLPPIYRSFITVFKPYFAHIKYKFTDRDGFGSFVVPIYSSQVKNIYSHSDDELAFESFRNITQLFSCPRSNQGYLKDYLLIASHGYAGGLLLGIGKENSDQIFHTADTTVIEPMANNIFELIQKFQLVDYHFIEQPKVDEQQLYKLWGEDFWRVKNESK